MSRSTGADPPKSHAFGLRPPAPTADGDPRIDASLARGIQRSYFRRLLAEWASYTVRRIKASGRNKSPRRRVDSQKQLRERFDELLHLMGGLLPICHSRLDAHSRGNAVIFAIKPEPVPSMPKADNAAHLHAFVLFQPGSLCEYKLPIRISGHAFDRVIQRAGLVAMPVGGADIQAINAELADAVLLASFAMKVIEWVAQQEGPDAQRSLQVILPSAHGAFLGSWSQDEDILVIRTFVDNDKLAGPQRQALRELRAITDADLVTPLIEALAPGWFGPQVLDIREHIAKAWRHYGWRFSEDRLHPGLSDRAWQVRPDA